MYGRRTGGLYIGARTGAWSVRTTPGGLRGGAIGHGAGGPVAPPLPRPPLEESRKPAAHTDAAVGHVVLHDLPGRDGGFLANNIATADDGPDPGRCSLFRAL